MATFHFRRELTRRQELQALGAAAGAALATGAAALYLARVWLQRTPVRDARPPVVFEDGLTRAAAERSPFAAPTRRAP